MHGQWENWTGCLLGRAINLQLEVNDKWDGKKKSWFLAHWNRAAWLCPVPPARQLPGGTGAALLPFWESRAVPHLEINLSF